MGNIQGNEKQNKTGKSPAKGKNFIKNLNRKTSGREGKKHGRKKSDAKREAVNREFDKTPDSDNNETIDTCDKDMVECMERSAVGHCERASVQSEVTVPRCGSVTPGASLGGDSVFVEPLTSLAAAGAAVELNQCYYSAESDSPHTDPRCTLTPSQTTMPHDDANSTLSNDDRDKEEKNNVFGDNCEKGEDEKVMGAILSQGDRLERSPHEVNHEFLENRLKACPGQTSFTISKHRKVELPPVDISLDILDSDISEIDCRHSSVSDVTMTESNVLRKVASLTLDRHSDTKVVRPKFVPEKLNFQLYEKFEEHYHSESVLWNAKHLHHKDKNKHHDAWRRISTLMDIEVNQLKKKKDSLLSSYRFYRKKVRDSSHSGAGAEEIYKPIWFAYSYMDSFLGEGLTVRKTTDTLNQESNVQDSQENNQENVDPVPLSDENPTITKRRRKNPPELQQAGSFIKESLANLNQALSRNNPQEKEDDCDRFGKILANKLRQLPEDDRLIFMHQIDGMFIQRRCSRNQSLPSSPIFVASPSPSSNILHQQNTSRPGSSFTSYSEPIITQYPPVLHIPEHSNTNTTTIRILSNQIVSPPPPPPGQNECFSQSQYECNLIGDAYENA